MSNTLELQKFYVSEDLGFILRDPLTKLPEYFEPWNSLASKMGTLTVNKQLRDHVHKLELLDHKQLRSHRELRLAHLQLSLITAGYVWQNGDSGAAKVLPRCIAVPHCGVSERLGIQPILCHSSLVLANCMIDEKTREWKSLYNLPGGLEAESFITVTVEVEMAFTAGMKNLVNAVQCNDETDVETLTGYLDQIPDMLHNMKTALAKLHEKVSGETFFNVLRPFFTGWGQPSSPLPEGIIYEGVSDKPMKMTGGSAAQSCTLQCLDAALAVVHSPDVRKFMDDMRLYMLPAHRQFIQHIEQCSNIKRLVEKFGDEKLTESYNRCLQAVVDFRTYHIQIVAKYVVVMSNKRNKQYDYDSITATGTGGSNLIPFLKDLRTATEETKHDTTQHQHDDITTHSNGAL